uniref:Proteophosphoglycan ppg4 n=1 Tax=Mycena chlorophos TaxID=658473 RepID=A0ABQ0L0K0_MYCCL|nr:predicted protein [Mycena chlorophos]
MRVATRGGAKRKSWRRNPRWRPERNSWRRNPRWRLEDQHPRTNPLEFGFNSAFPDALLCSHPVPTCLLCSHPVPTCFSLPRMPAARKKAADTSSSASQMDHSTSRRSSRAERAERRGRGEPATTATKTPARKTKRSSRVATKDTSVSTIPKTSSAASPSSTVTSVIPGVVPGPESVSAPSEPESLYTGASAHPTQKRADIYERARLRALGVLVPLPRAASPRIPLSPPLPPPAPPRPPPVVFVPNEVLAKAATQAITENANEMRAVVKRYCEFTFCWVDTKLSHEELKSRAEQRRFESLDKRTLRSKLRREVEEIFRTVSQLYDRLDPILQSSVAWMLDEVRQQATRARVAEQNHSDWFAGSNFLGFASLQIPRAQQEFSLAWIGSRKGQLALEAINVYEPLVASFRANVRGWSGMLRRHEIATLVYRLMLSWRERGGRGWLDDVVTEYQELLLLWQSLEKPRIHSAGHKKKAREEILLFFPLLATMSNEEPTANTSSGLPISYQINEVDYEKAVDAMTKHIRDTNEYDTFGKKPVMKFIMNPATLEAVSKKARELGAEVKSQMVTNPDARRGRDVMHTWVKVSHACQDAYLDNAIRQIQRRSAQKQTPQKPKRGTKRKENAEKKRHADEKRRRLAQLDEEGEEEGEENQDEDQEDQLSRSSVAVGSMGPPIASPISGLRSASAIVSPETPASFAAPAYTPVASSSSLFSGLRSVLAVPLPPTPSFAAPSYSPMTASSPPFSGRRSASAVAPPQAPAAFAADLSTASPSFSFAAVEFARAEPDSKYVLVKAAELKEMHRKARTIAERSERLGMPGSLMLVIRELLSSIDEAQELGKAASAAVEDVMTKKVKREE